MCRRDASPSMSSLHADTCKTLSDCSEDAGTLNN
jgi:hypothetical protein